jgi:hypothetical protein
MTSELIIDSDWKATVVTNTKQEKHLIYLNQQTKQIAFHPPVTIRRNNDKEAYNFKQTEKSMIEAFFSFYGMCVNLNVKQEIINFLFSDKISVEDSISSESSSTISEVDFSNKQLIQINSMMDIEKDINSSLNSSISSSIVEYTNEDNSSYIPLSTIIHQKEISFDNVEIDDPRVPSLFSKKISPYNLLQKYTKKNNIKLIEEFMACNDTIDNSNLCKFIISTNHNNELFKVAAVKKNKKEAREQASQFFLKSWFPKYKWKDLIEFISD